MVRRLDSGMLHAVHGVVRGLAWGLLPRQEALDDLSVGLFCCWLRGADLVSKRIHSREGGALGWAVPSGSTRLGVIPTRSGFLLWRDGGGGIAGRARRSSKAALWLGLG